jgi:hypothetical protein
MESVSIHYSLPFRIAGNNGALVLPTAQTRLRFCGLPSHIALRQHTENLANARAETASTRME